VVTFAHGKTVTGPPVADNAATWDTGDPPEGGLPAPVSWEPGPSEWERAAIELLERGTLEVEGRLVEASNATLFCTIRSNGSHSQGAVAQETVAQCVYKPVAGERPLWDFPHGTLAGREVAAYLVSRAAGWNFVPPTVLRDGPYGPGMCQLWIDLDEDVDLLRLARSTDNELLRELAVFDAVVNNADRKIGHLLPVPGGHLYGCDHGICFAEEYKLRTVLWQWRGEPLPERATTTLRRLAAGLADGWLARDLEQHLTRAEVAATATRIDLMLESKVHPYPSEDWPAVPWPPV
jgi:uncharacterized repeat protein (TIGR03843 family)